MKKQKILYTITAEDVINISEQEDITFTKKDLPRIATQILERLFLPKFVESAQEFIWTSTI